MSDLITYDDKIRLKSQNVSDKYKVTAEDMNEIKKVVNTNATEGVSVGEEAPTDGRRVWFEKGKNLLQNNFISQTISGVTFTKNSDGTILVNGTATADISLPINYVTLEAGSYILTGCPSGGASTTYSMILEGVARDIGSGKTFSVVNNKRVLIEIKNGTNCSNLLFEPMITKGSIAITYEPYVEKSIKVDNEDFASMDNLVSVGANQPSDGKRVWFKKSKNLLKLNLITTATTYSGVTFTPNNDGTITLNGTATGSRWVDLSNMEISSNSFNLGAVTNTTKSLTNNNYTLSAKLTNGQVNVSFNSTNKMTSCYLYENTTYNNAILQIQFEKGPATTYEQYIEASINVDEELLYQKPVVLWTNPNPTSSFASQIITLGESIKNYKYYEILYKTYKDENIGYNTGKIPVEWTTNLYEVTNASDGGTRNRIRAMTINNSMQIGFTSCSLINTKGDAYTFPDNDRLIPYKILGYKE